MKKLWTVFLLMFSLGAMAEKIEVKVSGMVCSMCAQGIQKKFSGTSGLKNLSVDLDHKLVTIETEKGKSVSDSVIKEAIAKAGYNVSTIKRHN